MTPTIEEKQEMILALKFLFEQWGKDYTDKTHPCYYTAPNTVALLMVRFAASLNRQGCRWTKASEFEYVPRKRYLAKWDEGYTEGRGIRSSGFFQESDGTFFWSEQGFVPIGASEHKDLYILDESIEPCADMGVKWKEGKLFKQKRIHIPTEYTPDLNEFEWFVRWDDPERGLGNLSLPLHPKNDYFDSTNFKEGNTVRFKQVYYADVHKSWDCAEIEPCATSSEKYWKQRCEAAEHILLQFPYSVLQDQAEEIYNRWQQLKTALPILKNK